MASKDQEQAKLKKRLEALLKVPENQICADCRKRGPRWASANLGIFFCIECSGIHRNLGVHISFVRSVNLDSWTEQQVQFMEEWGNGRSNELYEANLPQHVARPKEGDQVRVVEKFIRDKYEAKKYMAKAVPPKRDTITNNAASQPAAVEIAKRQIPQATAQPVTRAPVLAPKPQAVDLLDFMGGNPAPVNNNLNMNDPFSSPPQQSNQASNDGFGDFSSGPTSVFDVPQPAVQQQQQQQANNNNLFGDFSSPVSAPPQVPQAPPKPQVDVLSLFGQSGMQGGGNMGMMGSMGQQNAFGMMPQQAMQGGYPMGQQNAFGMMPQQVMQGGYPIGQQNSFGIQQQAMQGGYPMGQQNSFGIQQQAMQGGYPMGQQNTFGIQQQGGIPMGDSQRRSSIGSGAMPQMNNLNNGYNQFGAQQPQQQQQQQQQPQQAPNPFASFDQFKR